MLEKYITYVVHVVGQSGMIRNVFAEPAQIQIEYVCWKHPLTTPPPKSPMLTTVMLVNGSHCREDGGFEICCLLPQVAWWRIVANLCKT